MAVAEMEPVEIADAPAAPSGPRMPKRTEWVALGGDYAHMRMLVWTSYPYGIWKALQGLTDAGGLDAALRACVLEHDGWCSADGEPLPPADAPGFWWGDAVSPELVGVVISTLLDVPQRYPKGLRTNGTS